jgi:signal transduction histidine kinase
LNLRPQALEAKALDVALQDEVRKFNIEGKGTASFGVVGEKRPLSHRVETALLRICQESLTNILKHSGATQTNVVLRFGPDSVALKVSDNGIGFSVAQAQSRGGAPGMGLAGMEERAELLGGRFSVDSRPGEGTVIETQVPTE